MTRGWRPSATKPPCAEVGRKTSSESAESQYVLLVVTAAGNIRALAELETYQYAARPARPLQHPEVIQALMSLRATTEQLMRVRRSHRMTDTLCSIRQSVNSFHPADAEGQSGISRFPKLQTSMQIRRLAALNLIKLLLTWSPSFMPDSASLEPILCIYIYIWYSPPQRSTLFCLF